MTQSIEDRVKQIIIKQLTAAESEITLDKSFVDDLGADSLDVVELVMNMEEEFKIEIPEEKAESLRTVGDAVAYIKAHQG